MNEQDTEKVELSAYDMEMLLAAVDEQISNVLHMDTASEDWREKYVANLRNIERRLIGHYDSIQSPTRRLELYRG